MRTLGDAVGGAQEGGPAHRGRRLPRHGPRPQHGRRPRHLPRRRPRAHRQAGRGGDAGHQVWPPPHRVPPPLGRPPRPWGLRGGRDVLRHRVEGQPPLLREHAREAERLELRAQGQGQGGEREGPVPRTPGLLPRVRGLPHTPHPLDGPPAHLGRGLLLPHRPPARQERVRPRARRAGRLRPRPRALRHRRRPEPPLQRAGDGPRGALPQHGPQVRHPRHGARDARSVGL
mmetsp:Transcript_17048/g.43026  ORF Transcript_17048/g.43026 Transcript_17048/m.43026 type:complete len:230 (-) Transcript_17048:92-781(-)